MAKTASYMRAYRARKKAKQAQNSGWGNQETQPGHYDYEVANRRVEFTQEITGASREDAEMMVHSVSTFSGQGYTRIREHQMNGNGDEFTKVEAEYLEKYIKDAPKWAGGETYRGIIATEENIKSLTTSGAELDMRGTASWSTSLDTAMVYSGAAGAVANPGVYPVVFVSKTQKRGTSIRHLSKFKSEQEVTVSKTARYRVSSATRDAGYWRVEVEEL